MPSGWWRWGPVLSRPHDEGMHGYRDLWPPGAASRFRNPTPAPCGPCLASVRTDSITRQVRQLNYQRTEKRFNVRRRCYHLRCRGEMVMTCPFPTNGRTEGSHYRRSGIKLGKIPDISRNGVVCMGSPESMLSSWDSPSTTNAPMRQAPQSFQPEQGDAYQGAVQPTLSTPPRDC